MSDIFITKGNGNIFSSNVNEDIILGMEFYNAKMPNLVAKPIWVTAAIYAVGDVIFSTNQYYVCKTAHTAGATFAGDILNWDVWTGNTVKAFRNIKEVEKFGIVKNHTDWKFIWHQLNDYFTFANGNPVYLYIRPIPSTFDFSDVYDFAMKYMGGKLRMLGIFDDQNQLSANKILALQTVINQLEVDHAPIDVEYCPKFDTAVIDDTLVDLSALSVSCPNVHVIVGQDGDGEGYKLSSVNNGGLGVTLGVLSNTRVNESKARTIYNVGNVINKPALTNGVKFEELSKEQIELLETRNYTFFKTYSGEAGTYINDNRGCAPRESDYNSQDLVRTINKLIRKTRKGLFPLLNGSYATIPGSGGKPTTGTISLFTTAIDRELSKMVLDGEIVEYSVFIDPNQIITVGSKIYVQIRVVPTSIIREIYVDLGYTL